MINKILKFSLMLIIVIGFGHGQLQHEDLRDQDIHVPFKVSNGSPEGVINGKLKDF